MNALVLRGGNPAGDRSPSAMIGPLLLTLALISPVFPAWSLPDGTYMVLLFTAMAVGLARLLQRGTLVRTGITWILLSFVFLIWLLASLLWTPGPAYGQQKLLSFLTRSLGPALLLGLLPTIDANWRRGRVWFAIVAVASAIPSLLVADDGGAFFRFSYGGNPIWYGRMCALAALSAAGLAYEEFGERTANRSLTRMLAWIGAVVVLSFATLLSGSRGAFWLLLAVLTGQFLLAARVLRWRIPKLLGAGVVAISVVLFALPYVTDLAQIRYGPAARVMSLINGGLLDRSNLGRLDRMNEAWHLVQKGPGFGYGLGSSGRLLSGQDVRDYPHNLPLELWLETGVIGLVLFLVTQSWILWYAAGPRGKGSTTWLLPMWLYAFASVFISGDLGSNYELWILCGTVIAVASAARGRGDVLPAGATPNG